MATAVVLDIVESRTHPDQTRLLAGVADRVQQVLVDAGRAASAGSTAGDELQARYDQPGDAVVDLARLRLSLLVEPPAGRPVEVRAGIGVGEVDTAAVDATAPGQSGTAWWHAREAVEHAARQRNGWPPLRWWVVGDDVRVLRATLVALDTIAARFDDTDRVAALGLLDGEVAAQLAERIGVTGSTLSSRLHRHGVYGWVRTLQVLGGDA